MKFGKRLRDQIEDTLPDWKSKFLSYKDLKKRLKGHAASDSLCTGESATAQSCGAVAASHPLDQFVHLLNLELEKFNNFFMEKEEEFVIRMQEVKERIEKEKHLCPGRSLASCSDCDGAVNYLRRMIVSLHGEMVLLENYSSLNYTGLVKILKKYDKRTGQYLRHPFISNVLQQPFYTTELLAKLIKECEQLLQEVFPCSPPAAAENDKGSFRVPQDRSPAPSAEPVRLQSYVATDRETAAVYRNAVSALRSLQEIRGSSKTPHPLLVEAESGQVADLIPLSEVADDDSDDASADGCQETSSEKRGKRVREGTDDGSGSREQAVRQKQPVEAVGSSGDVVGLHGYGSFPEVLGGREEDDGVVAQTVLESGEIKKGCEQLGPMEAKDNVASGQQAQIDSVDNCCAKRSSC